MSSRDPLVYVDDILEAIAHIEQYLNGVDHESFVRDVQLQDAVIRRLEIIGEAVKKLPDEWQKHYPHLPWKAIARTRDKLIHDYFGIDIQYIWDITGRDLAVVKQVMQEIIATQEKKIK